MIRYIIKNKETGKYLKRTRSYGITSSWVEKVSDATLITTASAASQIAGRFCKGDPASGKFRIRSQSWKNWPVEVIAVSVLLFPVGAQPFFDKA